jgi:hypothetical protein
MAACFARPSLIAGRHEPGCLAILGRDASRIAEEVVQHFSSIVGSKVRATLELQVELLENTSDKLVRDVTENRRTPKFDDFGFEVS